jgi:NADH-quinone oxidoreductase subunit N
MNLTLSLTDYLALTPLLIVFGTGLLLILVELFCESKKALLSWIQVTGLLLALYASYTAPASDNLLLTPWIKFDAFARFFSLFFIAVTLGITLISSPFFKRFEASRAEFYFFLLSSTFGLMLISASGDYLTLFLGLETLSIALYVLCGYMKKWTASHEAAFKYFLLGSISTAFLLFGIALVYGATGSTRLDILPTQQGQLLFFSGISLITVSLLFKAAVVPFHVWAPDVYAGAPTPVTAFMAVGTKAGAFAALIRIFLLNFPQFDALWHQAIAWLAYVTLIYANFVALRQFELRRFFAYSGISHAGFLLIPLAAGGMAAAPSMLFYLVVYSIATFGAFAVLSFIDDTSEGVALKDLKGLWHKSPLLAGIFILVLLTLAGIPPTIGFFAKFYILKVGFEAGYYGLVIVGLLTTILSAFYYLRIASVMFSPQQIENKHVIRSKSASVATIFALGSIIALSFYPEPLLQLFGTVCKI